MVDHSTTSTDNSRRCDTNHHDIPSSSSSLPPPLLPPPTTTTMMTMNQNHAKDAVTIDGTKNTVNHDDDDDTHCHTKCRVSVRPMNQVLEHPSFPTTDHPIKSSSSSSIGGSNTVGTTTTTHIGNHSLCHSHPHNHHNDKNHCCDDENKDIETVVSVTIQKLHSVLDRIIQQNMIDPMMEQYHISKQQQQQMLEEEDEWNNNHIMKPSDPNQSNAFLVRRWIFTFFSFLSSRFDIL